jgi:uncharacterized protein YndB with AHSA1/START domain
VPKPEFIYVTYIETTPEKLWEALTSSEFSRQYWFGTELRTDWTIGSPLALVTHGTPTDVGEILEFDPPRRLSYTFSHVLRDELRNSKGWPAIISGLKSLLETGTALAIAAPCASH